MFLLEDDDKRIEWFRSRLTDHDLHIATTADAGVACLVEHGTFDFVFLDHDLELEHYGNIGGYDEHGDTGLVVARSIAETGYVGDNVLIHSWNPWGAANMAACFERNAIVCPFGQFEIETT